MDAETRRRSFPQAIAEYPDMQKRSDLILPGLSVAFAAIFAASTAAAQSSEPPKSETETPQQSTVPQSAQDTPADAAAPQKKSWSDLDTDKDGNLSKSEAAPIPSLQAVFDKADANADGALTGEEYKTYLAVNGQPSPTKPKK
jgi:hypothetical protein